jgi:hypothetical protein
MRSALILVFLAIPSLARAQVATPRFFVSTTPLAINACSSVEVVTPWPAATANKYPSMPNGKPFQLTEWNLTVTPQTSPPGSVVWSNSSAIDRAVCACAGAVVGDSVTLLATYGATIITTRKIGVAAAAGRLSAPGCPTPKRPDLVGPATVLPGTSVRPVKP